jgi:hypothetical protein
LNQLPWLDNRKRRPDWFDSGSDRAESKTHSQNHDNANLEALQVLLKLQPTVSITSNFS